MLQTETFSARIIQIESVLNHILMVIISLLAILQIIDCIRMPSLLSPNFSFVEVVKILLIFYLFIKEKRHEYRKYTSILHIPSNDGLKVKSVF